MTLNITQNQAFINIVKYGKAFIFWGKQTGKSHLLSHIIQTYVANKKSEDIVFFVNQKNHIQSSKLEFIKNSHNSIRLHSKSARKQKPEEVFLINNNYLTICSIKEYDYYLYHLKPSLIVFDDFSLKNGLDNYNCLIKYLQESNCKVVFTSINMDMSLIRILDINNEYYINIMQCKDILTGISTKVIVPPNIIDELSYKPDELIDYDNVIFQRRKKLKQLKILSEE